MAQTHTILSKNVETIGNRAMVLGYSDANGTATGSVTTGLTHIEVAFTGNYENKNEVTRVVRNSNDGTEGSSMGTVYFDAQDSTNNTWYWIVIGVR